MQHHPVVNYLRIFGFALGLVLFVFMLLHFERSAKDPVYVRGKPSLQWVAVAGQQSLRASADSVDPKEEAAAAPTSDSRKKLEAAVVRVQPASANSHGNNAAAQSAGNQVQKTSQPEQAGQSTGKALGKTKHAE